MIGSMQLGSVMMNYARYTEQKTSGKGQVNSFSGVYESKSAASVDAARTEETTGTERLFDFACALAGDDVDKMKEMQAAVEKGFKQATGAWGRELPSICKDTFDATNKLFDDYYASKEEQTEIQ